MPRSCRHTTPYRRMIPLAKTPLLGALLAVAAGACLPRTSLAQMASPRGADSAEVVRVSEALMTAISTRDSAAARVVLLPGAILAAAPDPEAPTAARVQADAAFLTTLATSPVRFLERIWQPTVRITGTVAVVSAPYDFHRDGVFSHCGTDVLTLTKAQGRWRIASVIYTVQRTGCAPSPLGPPK